MLTSNITLPVATLMSSVINADEARINVDVTHHHRSNSSIAALMELVINEPACDFLLKERVSNCTTALTACAATSSIRPNSPVSTRERG
jgi:hypothetical protein